MTPGIPHNTTLNAWPDAALEQYHDGELAGEAHAALTEALCADPALRERLTRIAQFDTIMHAALKSNPAHETTEVVAPARRQRIRIGVIAAVAALALIATAAFIFQPWRSAPNPDNIAQAAPHHDVIAEPAVRERSVVLSLVLHRKDTDTVIPPASKDRPQRFAAAQMPFAQQLDSALANNDIDAALLLMGDATPAQRELAADRLGKFVRTGKLAAQILDLLPPTQQLAVCESWVQQPHLRVAAFARLSALVADPDVSADVAQVVSDLRAQPALAGWLRSYHLDQTSL